MDIIERLPISLKFKIMRFLIYTDVIDHNTKKSWCVKCGEQMFNNYVCAGKKCLNCCYLHCVNKSNFYLDPSKSEPFSFDDDISSHN